MRLLPLLMVVGLLFLVGAAPAHAFQLAGTPSSSVYWLGATAPPDSQASGVQAQIQVESFSVSGCLAFWVSEAASDDIWSQVGYYLCDGSTPTAFYQIWDLTNPSSPIGTGSASVSTGVHTFSEYATSATEWTYMVDGSSIGTFDVGSSTGSSSYPVYSLSEEQASAQFSIPLVSFPVAIQERIGGQWVGVQAASAYNEGGSWGLEGNLQDPSVASNSILVGGSLSTPIGGTQLWSSSSTSTTSTSTTGTISGSSSGSLTQTQVAEAGLVFGVAVLFKVRRSL